MNISEKYNAWLACLAMNDELMQELRTMDEQARNDSFYRDLSFGTGGLRGILGAGTNRMNLFTVAKATRGLARYLKASFSEPSYRDPSRITSLRLPPSIHSEKMVGTPPIRRT